MSDAVADATAPRPPDDTVAGVRNTSPLPASPLNVGSIAVPDMQTRVNDPLNPLSDDAVKFFSNGSGQYDTAVPSNPQSLQADVRQVMSVSGLPTQPPAQVGTTGPLTNGYVAQVAPTGTELPPRTTGELPELPPATGSSPKLQAADDPVQQIAALRRELDATKLAAQTQAARIEELTRKGEQQAAAYAAAQQELQTRAQFGGIAPINVPKMLLVGAILLGFAGPAVLPPLLVAGAITLAASGVLHGPSQAINRRIGLALRKPLQGIQSLLGRGPRQNRSLQSAPDLDEPGLDRAMSPAYLRGLDDLPSRSEFPVIGAAQQRGNTGGLPAPDSVENLRNTGALPSLANEELPPPAQGSRIAQTASFPGSPRPGMDDLSWDDFPGEEEPPVIGAMHRLLTGPEIADLETASLPVVAPTRPASPLVGGELRPSNARGLLTPPIPTRNKPAFPQPKPRGAAGNLLANVAKNWRGGKGGKPRPTGPSGVEGHGHVIGG